MEDRLLADIFFILSMSYIFLLQFDLHTMQNPNLNIIYLYYYAIDSFWIYDKLVLVCRGIWIRISAGLPYKMEAGFLYHANFSGKEMEHFSAVLFDIMGFDSRNCYCNHDIHFCTKTRTCFLKN